MKKTTILKGCLTALFLVFFNIYNSQILIIQDSLTKEKLNYSEININQKIYFSDSSGVFSLEGLANSEELTISRIGYKEKKITIKNNEKHKTILLQPIYKEITEVKINQKKINSITDDYKKGNISALPLGIDIGYKIDNIFDKMGLLKNIIIPLKDIKNLNSYIKFDFYEYEGENISSSPLNNEPIFIPLSTLKKGDNLINLDDFKIQFPKNGILVGMRIVENVGEIKNIISKPVVSFYNSKKDGNVYFKNSSTNQWTKFTSGLPKISLSLNVLL